MNHPNSRPVSIYALLDPDTRAVRYVGWSIDPQRRLKGHLCASRRERNHRAYWIRCLLSAGKQPVMEIVEADVIQFAERERFWIDYYRKAGADLTNGTDGGEGMLGHCPTQETRRKMSERMRGRMSGINNPFAGKTHTPETRARLSAARQVRVTKPETRLKISAAVKRRIVTKETREKIGRVHRERLKNDPVAAQRIGNLFRGKQRSAESRQKMSLAKKGKRRSVSAQYEFEFLPIQAVS